MPATKRTKPTVKKKASKRASVPDSLEVRSNGWLRFVERDWSKQKRLVDAVVDTVARTALFEHLSLLSLNNNPAKPRGTLSALKTTFASGKSDYALLQGGKTFVDEKTTAFITVELTRGGVDMSTFVRGETLAELGTRALDDFFTIYTSLHDELDGAAHVVCAHAWTNWDGNPREPRRISDWPLRGIADVVEPGRPRKKDDDPFLNAAQAIAKAKPPKGITRTTHGGLVLIRCIEDPTDARAALDAALKHDKWLQGVVKNEELPRILTSTSPTNSR